MTKKTRSTPPDDTSTTDSPTTRIAGARVLTKKKNKTPTADTTTIVMMPVEPGGPPPGEYPMAAFGTVPELPRPEPATATLKDIATRWLDHMTDLGKTRATVSSYEGDLSIAISYFGESIDPSDLTQDQIAAFEASDQVTKTRSGKGKAQPTVLKTRRALRLAITWAHGAGLLRATPYATKI